MANNFIKIDNLTGSIFGNVTVNNYGGAKDTDSNNAEDVSFEEVKTPSPKPSEDSTYTIRIEQSERKEALTKYICQLEKIVTRQYANSFKVLVEELIQDKDISEWLLDVRRCNFREYNKNRVFRFAQFLKTLGVISYNKDIDLNKVLENSDTDTSYRKSLARGDSNEEMILRILKSRITK